VFIDFESSGDLPFEPDICIVGAGIAGLTLVSALRGLKILVLEGGGLTHEPQSQSLFESEIDFAGALNIGAVDGRFRVFGGSGTQWSGALIPMAPYEMTGWPIDNDMLAPYFDQLDTMLQLRGSRFDQGGDIRVAKILPAHRRDLGRIFRKSLIRDPNVVVLYHANVVEVVGNYPDLVTGIRVRSLTGRHQIFPVRTLVIAAGAIETVRLLLVSRSLRPDRWKHLGCGFNDHIVLHAGEVIAVNHARLRRMFRGFYIGGVLHVPRFQPSIPGYALVFFEAAPDSAFVKFREGTFCPSLDLVAGVLARCVALKPISRRSTPVVHLVAEQPSRSESRIRLAGELDALGMPRVRLEWRIGEEEQRTLTTVGRALESILMRRQIGTVMWSREAFHPKEGARLDHAVDQYHHAGGARMGEVVNADCRVQGMQNLYLASAAVFPSGGCSNPAFTIMALALRLAEHLRRQPKRGADSQTRPVVVHPSTLIR